MKKPDTKFHASKGATVEDVRAGGFEASKPLCGASLAKAFSAEGLRSLPYVEGREHVNCVTCLEILQSMHSDGVPSQDTGTPDEKA